MVSRKPAAPADLEKRGRAFWREVLKIYELNVDEMQLLAEACRTLDDCDRLRVVIETEGQMIKGSTGQSRLHPAIGELRQTRTALAKFLAQLGLPDAEGGASLPTPESRRASRAADARWNQKRYLDQKRQEAARRG